MPVIRNFLDLSTAHIKPETIKLLGKTDLEDWPLSASSTNYGLFVWCDEAAHKPGSTEPNEQAREPDMPEEIWRAMAYARAHGCDYILYDVDAQEDPNLPTYEHE